MKKNWKLAKADPRIQIKLSKGLNIHPLFAQILINRGIIELEDAEFFLNASLSSLCDPMKLKDMDKVKKRIKKAINNRERILIFGDYDVDGITACSLLKSVLLKLDADVIHYIPHRINEGYGLNKNAIESAKQKGVKLFITVDCGINSDKEVTLLNKYNIDIIIIDHHQPAKENLPAAFGIINPKRSDCSYPYNDLAAVGLAYKVSQVISGENLEEYLDLVALGTVADVMTLKGENRILVKEGLKYLNSKKRPGINALIDTCGLKGRNILPGFISYILGPRINASGRIGSAENSLRLLLTCDIKEAQNLAGELNRYNRERQKIQEQILNEALNLIDREINFKDHLIIVISKEGWHQGVLGIVASKIADKFYRPTIVISTNKGIGKGSARSIDGFHIFDALSQCSELLQDFGGHKYAAGLTILEDNIKDFKESINRFAKDDLSEDDLLSSLEIDAKIPLSLLDIDLISQIETFGPFGVGNPYPVFCSDNVKIKSRPTIVGRDTIKFWVTDGKLTSQVVGFGMGRFFDVISKADSLDLAYSPSLDTWSEPTAIQLELKDVRIN